MALVVKVVLNDETNSSKLLSLVTENYTVVELPFGWALYSKSATEALWMIVIHYSPRPDRRTNWVITLTGKDGIFSIVKGVNSDIGTGAAIEKGLRKITDSWIHPINGE